MFLYEVLLWIGLLGFGTTLLLGFISGHGGHDAGHHGGHAHPDLTPGQHHAPVAAHVKGIHAKSSTSGMKLGKFSRLRWMLISPIDIFSFCLAAGAVGLTLRRQLEPNFLLIAAIAGGLIFAFGIIRPLFSALMGFASRPSEGLEGAVALPAEAVTRFDSQGKGLIKLNLDGEVVQLLANLSAEDQASGVRVQKGEEVVVLEVDPKRNTCVVTRQLSS